jgi:nucleotide-binding universal stress UspA family protein
MKKNNLIWAMDPSQKPEQAIELIKELRMWAKRLKCQVQPVSIFPTSSVYLPAEITFDWQADLAKDLKRSAEQYRAKTKTKDFLETKMIFSSSLSNRGFAHDLAKYADRRGALMIFANTRAKQTWNPFRLGGFAETLVATARTPVLLMNAKAKATRNVDSILFPTDLSADSKNALLRLLPWAKSFGSKITMYNHVENPADSLNYLSKRQEYADLIQDLEKERQDKMSRLAFLAREQGVRSENLVRVQKKYLAQEIVELGKKQGVDLIALISRSGPVSQALIGGIPRDVLLHADRPVLVFYKPKILVQRNAKKKNAKRVVTTSASQIPIPPQAFPAANILV